MLETINNLIPLALIPIGIIFVLIQRRKQKQQNKIFTQHTTTLVYTKVATIACQTTAELDRTINTFLLSGKESGKINAVEDIKFCMGNQPHEKYGAQITYLTSSK